MPESDTQAITLIVAVADNNVIGQGGGLPWRLPDDLKHFKNLTSGGIVLMGRRTFESIGQALPNRRNIVITTTPNWHHSDVEAAKSLEEALALTRPGSEVHVVGGRRLYEEALPRAQKLQVTRVHTSPSGDVFFPDIDWSNWHLVDEQHHPADERHAHPMTFQTHQRLG